MRIRRAHRASFRRFLSLSCATAAWLGATSGVAADEAPAKPGEAEAPSRVPGAQVDPSSSTTSSSSSGPSTSSSQSETGSNGAAADDALSTEATSPESTSATEGSQEGSEGEASEERKGEPPPRPPPLPETPRIRVPWERHIELGGGAALAVRPSSDPSGMRFRPALGIGVHGRWEFFRWLRFNIYFVGAVHEVSVPLGALGTPGEVTGNDPGTMPKVDTFAFGARLAPTLPIGDRARTWIGVGIGYGRFAYGRMTIREPRDLTYQVRQRAPSFAEVPFSFGTSVDLIRGWLGVGRVTPGEIRLNELRHQCLPVLLDILCLLPPRSLVLCISDSRARSIDQ